MKSGRTTNTVSVFTLATIFVVALFFSAEPVLAGFGISPPYVRNESLTRNSEYQQKIMLVRSDPTVDLSAKITVDVPGANGWITIDKGMEFIMPKGENKVPIAVKIAVPDDAEFKKYQGNLRVVISPQGGPTPGAVGIVMGAQIDVELAVIDKKIFDFKVLQAKILDLEEGKKMWFLFFPGKITFKMQIQNTGNVPYGPTKVTMDIYDIGGKNLLESTANTNKIKKAKPFETKEVGAELPTRLPAGAYIARYKIHKDDVVAREGELTLSVMPRGAVKDYRGYGFAGLNPRDKAAVSFFGAILFLAAAYIFVKIWKKKHSRKRRQ